MSLLDLNNFLEAHRVVGNQYYNVLGIDEFRGKYKIYGHEYRNFLRLVHDNSSMRNINLLEKNFPGKDFGPIFIDLDFIYEDHGERPLQYLINDRYISQFVDEYIRAMETVFELPRISYRFFVQRKPAPELLDGNRIKEGVHIICPDLLLAYHKQRIIRGYMLGRMHSLFYTRCLKTEYYDVFDYHTTTSKNGWFIYGCGKPNKEVYVNTQIFRKNYGDNEIQTLSPLSYDKLALTYLFSLHVGKETETRTNIQSNQDLYWHEWFNRIWYYETRKGNWFFNQDVRINLNNLKNIGIQWRRWYEPSIGNTTKFFTIENLINNLINRSSSTEQLTENSILRFLYTLTTCTKIIEKNQHIPDTVIYWKFAIDSDSEVQYSFKPVDLKEVLKYSFNYSHTQNIINFLNSSSTINFLNTFSIEYGERPRSDSEDIPDVEREHEEYYNYMMSGRDYDIEDSIDEVAHADARIDSIIDEAIDYEENLENEKRGRSESEDIPTDKIIDFVEMGRERSESDDIPIDEIDDAVGDREHERLREEGREYLWDMGWEVLGDAIFNDPAEARDRSESDSLDVDVHELYDEIQEYEYYNHYEIQAEQNGNPPVIYEYVDSDEEEDIVAPVPVNLRPGRNREPTIPHTKLCKRIYDLIAADVIGKGDECSILFEPLTTENLAITTCFHFFTKEAIERWLSQNTFCPLCRQDTGLYCL